MGVHVGEDLRAAFAIAATDFGRGPAGEADLLNGLPDILPIDVTFSDLAEVVFDTPVLDVQFDDPSAELADPSCTRAGISWSSSSRPPS